jgi:hypothetical protein
MYRQSLMGWALIALRYFTFVCPDGVSFKDRSGHLFCHRQALFRPGINNISAGAQIEFRMKSPRRAGFKSECDDVVLLAA